MAVDAPSDAPADVRSEEGTVALSPTAAGAMALPRQDQPKSHQRANGFNASTKDTDNAPQDRQRRCDREAGLSASTIGDGRDVDEDCRLNDVALDGVIFMVYAKRL